MNEQYLWSFIIVMLFSVYNFISNPEFYISIILFREKDLIEIGFGVIVYCYFLWGLYCGAHYLNWI